MGSIMEDIRNETAYHEKVLFVESLWDDGIRDVNRVSRLARLSVSETDNIIKNLKMKTTIMA